MESHFCTANPALSTAGQDLTDHLQVASSAKPLLVFLARLCPSPRPHHLPCFSFYFFFPSFLLPLPKRRLRVVLGTLPPPRSLPGLSTPVLAPQRRAAVRGKLPAPLEELLRLPRLEDFSKPKPPICKSQKNPSKRIERKKSRVGHFFCPIKGCFEQRVLPAWALAFQCFETSRERS